MAPWADVLYACDHQWWYHHIDEVRGAFNGELWTQDVKAWAEFGVNYIKGQERIGLGENCIHFGGNSGYQAINLAYLWGASKIYLLGYDMQKTNNLSHWHGDHPRVLASRQPFSLWQSKFPHLARDLMTKGIPTVNLSRQTALECFKRATVDDL